MNSYLVERYLPGVSEPDLRAGLDRLRDACEKLASGGSTARYVGSIFLPQEETCFCRVDSDSAETAVRANQLAQLPFARITPAVAIVPARAQPPG